MGGEKSIPNTFLLFITTQSIPTILETQGQKLYVLSRMLVEIKWKGSLDLTKNARLSCMECTLYLP